jgi:hypothetical protein
MNQYTKNFENEIIKKLEQGLERSLYGTIEIFLKEIILETFKSEVFVISEQSSKQYEGMPNPSCNFTKDLFWSSSKSLLGTSLLE